MIDKILNDFRDKRHILETKFKMLFMKKREMKLTKFEIKFILSH
jgi:uncharacterized membrane protein YfbV (UPF0208 family)